MNFTICVKQCGCLRKVVKIVKKNLLCNLERFFLGYSGVYSGKTLNSHTHKYTLVCRQERCDDHLIKRTHFSWQLLSLSERRRVGGWDADAEESTDTQFTFCKSSLVIVNNGHSLELVRKSNIFFLLSELTFFALR